MLYALVFVTRYLDIVTASSFDLWAEGGAFVWNLVFKLIYLASSFYIVFIMMKVFPRTREKERAWKIGIWSVLGSLALAPIVILVFEGRLKGGWFLEVRISTISWFHIASLSLTVFLDLLGLFDHPRIRVRAAAAPAPASNYRPNSDRLVLPGHSRLLPGILHLELDGARVWQGRILGPCRIGLWDCADGLLPGFRMGVLLASTGEAAQWRRGRLGGL